MFDLEEFDDKTRKITFTVDETPLNTKILQGVNLLANTVKTTLGAKGRTVMFNDRYDRLMITKDGATVAKHIHHEDPYVEMAIKVIREASVNTMNSSGDGTTTTVVLAQSIINKYFDLLKTEGKTVSYYDFKKSAEKALQDVVNEIENNALSIEDHKEKLKLIATVSANDESIGDLIEEVTEKIGLYGDIEVNSNATISSIKVETVKGIRTNKGYFSVVFCNDKAQSVFEYDDVNILQYDGVLRNTETIMPFIEIAIRNQNALLVLVSDIAPVCLSQLEKAVQNRPMPIMFVEHDGIGDSRIEIMNDIVALTSASVVDESLDIRQLLNGYNSENPGTHVEQFSYLESLLGYCKHVKVTNSSCSLIDGDVDVKILNSQIEYVKNILATSDISGYQRKFNRKRLGYLSGGMAIINVGAQTALEMTELKDRVDDAVLAVKSAVRSGICIGGGFTWTKIFNALQRKPDYRKDVYYKIIVDSLTSVLKQLLTNAEIPHEYNNITNKMKKDYAYDLITNSYLKTPDYHIYDAASVLVDAITNAVAVSKSIISVNAAIFDGYVKS